MWEWLKKMIGGTKEGENASAGDKPRDNESDSCCDDSCSCCGEAKK